MTKFLLSAALAFLFSQASYAQSTSAVPIAGSGQYGVNIDSITTLTVPAGANFALLCVTGTANFTTDGTTPTISIGTLISTNCVPISGNATLKALKIIDTVAGATMNVQYFNGIALSKNSSSSGSSSSGGFTIGQSITGSCPSGDFVFSNSGAISCADATNGTVIYAAAKGVVADGAVKQDGVMVQGSTTLSSAGRVCTVADIGKIVVVSGNGTPAAVAAPTQAGTPPTWLTYSINQVAAASGAGDAESGGSLHYVKITYVGNTVGGATQQESAASAEVSFAVGANKSLYIQSPLPVSGAEGYNVYAVKSVGGGSGWVLQNTAPIQLGASWTEPLTGLVTGSAAPPAPTLVFTSDLETTVASCSGNNYVLNAANGSGGSFTASATSSANLVVSAVGAGQICVGQTVVGTGITGSPTISQLPGAVLAGCSSATGTYVMSSVQNVASEGVTSFFSALQWAIGTDQSATINSLIAANPNAKIVFPPGLILLNGTTIALSRISLEGAKVQPITGGFSNFDYTTGTEFLLTSSTVMPFTVGISETLSGINFYWPGQYGVYPDPVAFPPLFSNNCSTVTSSWYMDHVHILNSYQVFAQECLLPSIGTGIASNPILLMHWEDSQIFSAWDSIIIQRIGETFFAHDIDFSGNAAQTNTIGYKSKGYLQTFSESFSDLVLALGVNNAASADSSQCQNVASGSKNTGFQNGNLAWSNVQTHTKGTVFRIVGANFTENSIFAIDTTNTASFLNADAASNAVVNITSPIIQAYGFTNTGVTQSNYAINVDSTCTGGGTQGINIVGGYPIVQGGFLALGGNQQQDVAISGVRVVTGTASGPSPYPGSIVFSNNAQADVKIVGGDFNSNSTGTTGGTITAALAQRGSDTGYGVLTVTASTRQICLGGSLTGASVPANTIITGLPNGQTTGCVSSVTGVYTTNNFATVGSESMTVTNLYGNGLQIVQANKMSTAGLTFDAPYYAFDISSMISGTLVTSAITTNNTQGASPLNMATTGTAAAHQSINFSGANSFDKQPTIYYSGTQTNQAIAFPIGFQFVTEDGCGPGGGGGGGGIFATGSGGAGGGGGECHKTTYTMGDLGAGPFYLNGGNGGTGGGSATAGNNGTPLTFSKNSAGCTAYSIITASNDTTNCIDTFGAGGGGGPGLSSAVSVGGAGGSRFATGGQASVATPVGCINAGGGTGATLSIHGPSCGAGGMGTASAGSGNQGPFNATDLGGTGGASGGGMNAGVGNVGGAGGKALNCKTVGTAGTAAVGGTGGNGTIGLFGYLPGCSGAGGGGQSTNSSNGGNGGSPLGFAGGAGGAGSVNTGGVGVGGTGGTGGAAFDRFIFQ